ncbi:MAG: hypothetical protein MUF78_08900 [Candidatus Edwardsbacteria bacterium]|nr:hypothetical protein [Candidatus Edwardsbacteria bacterium]
MPIAEIRAKLPFLREKYRQVRTSKDDGAAARWIMGQIRPAALGNVALGELRSSLGQG